MAKDPSDIETELHIALEAQRDDMVQTLIGLLQIPAIGPASGGEGESAKAERVRAMMEEFGFDTIERYDAPDERVPSGVRPNIIGTVRGEDPKKRICIVAHMDVVPPGDLAKWSLDPFEPEIRAGRLFGRGSEDNGQELVAALYGVKILKEHDITPKYSVAVVCVADEETGSDYGISHLIQEGVFDENDLIIVPDSGNEEGTLMEVAEKSILWLKCETTGQQCHASTPGRGTNAFRAGSHLATDLDRELHSHYDGRDEKFDPPQSTFEPTKKEANVPNINTIPGDDIFYFDCRVLPQYDPDEVLETANTVAERVAHEHGVAIAIETVQCERAAPPTAADAPIVRVLKNAIESVYDIEPFAGGIGGGTCAAIFRRAGFPAVVWSTIDDQAHSPDEYIHIENLINDAKIYASLLANPQLD